VISQRGRVFQRLDCLSIKIVHDLSLDWRGPGRFLSSIIKAVSIIWSTKGKKANGPLVKLNGEKQGSHTKVWVQMLEQ